MNMNIKKVQTPQLKIVDDAVPFSFIKGRLKSFTYAWNGIVQFFKTEKNAQVHFVAVVVVIAVSILLKISNTETIAIVVSIAFVWITEMINTAIEKTMDFISTTKNDSIKLIKDVAAGAVLIAAIAAFVIGCIIFIPKLLLL